MRDTRNLLHHPVSVIPYELYSKQPPLPHKGERYMADTELTRFVYLVEGELQVGTIEDYAKAVESAHYNGMSVNSTVWIADSSGGHQ